MIPGFASRTRRLASMAHGPWMRILALLVFSLVPALAQANWTGRLSLNGGAAFAKSLPATATMSATSSSGAVTHRQLSWNGTNYTTWEAYGGFRGVTIPIGEGPKTLTARFKDAAGNISGAYTASITLDTTAPAGSMAICGGQPATTASIAKLTLSATDTLSGVTHMQFTKDNLTWTNWEAYATARTVTLLAGYGTRGITVRFKDGAGNVSAPISDTIEVSPITASLSLNGGASFAGVLPARATMTATSLAGAVTHRQLSWDGTHYTAWEAYSASRPVSIPASEGPKTLSARFMDASGNLSAVYTATLILDTTPPAGSVVINGGAASTPDRQVSLALQASDALSGVASMRFSNDGQTWTAWQAYARTATMALRASAGTQSVQVQFQDAAGNIASASGAIAFLPEAPKALLFAQDRVFPNRGGHLASVTPQPHMTYQWTLNSGTASAAITSGGDTPVVTYRTGAGTGTYTLSVRVENEAGEATTATKTLQVVSQAFVKDVHAPKARANGWMAPLADGRQLLVFKSQTDHPELFDPITETWRELAPMNQSRTFPAGTPLTDGTFLVSGGYPAGAERFDPSTNTWSSAGTTLVQERYSATAVALSDGRALITGGEDGNTLGQPTVFSSAELYDPSTNAWSSAGSMLAPRVKHVVTRLRDGRVLVAGGFDGDYMPLSSAEIFDPATGTWTPTGSPNAAWVGATAILLPGGEVLVAGGTYSGTATERFDPLTGLWRQAASMGTARPSATLTLLPDGRALAVGKGAAETYDPIADTWIPAGHPRVQADHQATLLPDGRVLVVSEFGQEFYHPATNLWSGDGSLPLATDAKKLPGEDVLVRSGNQWARYNASSGAWTAAAPPPSAPTDAAISLDDGRLLFLGNPTQIYDPASGAWSEVSAPTTRALTHSAILLESGKVLAVASNGETEIYNATTDTWTSSTPSPAGLLKCLVLLADGSVLGIKSSASFTSYRYDPATAVWTEAWTPEFIYTMDTTGFYDAVPLANGKVLYLAYDYSAIAMHVFAFTSKLLLADLAAGTTESPYGISGIGSTVTPLADGSVLIAGGQGYQADDRLSSAKRYDPVTDTTSSVGAMRTAGVHADIQLEDGRILFLGGGVPEFYQP